MYVYIRICIYIYMYNVYIHIYIKKYVCVCVSLCVCVICEIGGTEAGSRRSMSASQKTALLAAFALACAPTHYSSETRPGGNPGANFMSIYHRCQPILVVFVW